MTVLRPVEIYLLEREEQFKKHREAMKKIWDKYQKAEKVWKQEE